MNLVKIKPKFQVTIPHSVRRHVRLGVGDVVEVEARRNFILIKPKVLKDKAKHDEIEAAIAAGLKDIEEGRVFGPFSSIEEFKAHIKKQAV